MMIWHIAEPFRLTNAPGYETKPGDDYGAFLIPHAKTGVKLQCLAVSGAVSARDLGKEYAWDHVSVSLPNRCPNWIEMDFVRSIFWTDDETVMQLHVPVKEHRNLHPNCLHLWRPLLFPIPRPPNDTVADLPTNR